MNAKYLFGKIISLPLLPIMYFQSKRIKANFPSLPEATGIEGYVSFSSKRKVKILTIGESTIAGVGVNTHKEGFTGTLAQALSSYFKASIDWKVYAKSGYTAKKVVDIIIPEIKEKQVDLIVIGLGGNDSFELNTPKKWRIHIQELINKLRSSYPNTPIVFANMPPIKEFIAFTSTIKFVLGNLAEIFGEELEKLIKNQDNIYFSSQKIVLKEWRQRLDIKVNQASFFSDGLHPSKLTYQIWAKDLAKFILEKGIIRLEVV